MADFKFSCPSCGQRIQCDAGYCGTQIACPACQHAIVVPQAPAMAGGPPPPPPPRAGSPGLATRQSTGVPGAGQRFAGAPGAGPAPKPKSNAVRNSIIIAASVVVLAGFGAGGWFGYKEIANHEMAVRAKRGNPAAAVATPSAAQSSGAVGILQNAYAAYTNLNSYSANMTLMADLDLSKVTAADLNPDQPGNNKNPKRRPAGMPRTITNSTEMTIKRARPLSYYVAGESKTAINGMPTPMAYTFAYWSSGESNFMFMDTHQRGARPMYMELPENPTAKAMAAGAMELPQDFFEATGPVAKVVKDLGQTEDDTVGGQDCYTLTGKILGQKVKVWVSKSTSMILQWQITLGGALSDGDIDDAFSVFENSGKGSQVQTMQMEMAKTQFKKIAPMMAKIRGEITLTSDNVQVNPSLGADDFSYAVPSGVRLMQMPAGGLGAGGAAARRRGGG